MNYVLTFYLSNTKYSVKLVSFLHIVLFANIFMSYLSLQSTHNIFSKWNTHLRLLLRPLLNAQLRTGDLPSQPNLFNLLKSDIYVYIYMLFRERNFTAMIRVEHGASGIELKGLQYTFLD